MYEHRTEFVTKIDELRLNLPVPKELSPEDFNTGANFEFHPTLKTFLFVGATILNQKLYGYTLTRTGACTPQ